MRFGVIGTLNFKRKWVYTVFFASRGYNNDSTDTRLTLYDLRLDIPILANMNISIGKQKESISMERLTSLVFLPWQERSAAADALIPIRNYGVVLNGTAFGNRSSWATGVFKNWIDSDVSWSETPTQWTTRITGIPAISTDDSNLLHLGASLRYSGGREDLVGKTEAEFFQAPIFVETV